jgi:hypothetical protein
MAATLYAVAGEPEDEQPILSGGVTVADILASITEAQELHPEWFKPGQGWGTQPEEKAK